MIVLEQQRQQVQRVRSTLLPVLRIDKRRPRHLRVLLQHALVRLRQVQSVLAQILVQALRPQHLHLTALRRLHLAYLDQLVVVVHSLEHRLLPEQLRVTRARRTHQRRSQAPSRKHVQRVVVVLQRDQQLGGLVVARRHPHVVFLPRVVELRQAPVDQPQLRVALLRGHALAVVHNGGVLRLSGGGRVLENDVLGLHITMDDSVLVRVVQRLR